MLSYVLKKTKTVSVISSTPSSGRHRCIGENFAYVQIKTIWSTLLRMFDFDLVDGYFPTINYTTMIHTPHNPIIRYKRRKQWETDGGHCRGEERRHKETRQNILSGTWILGKFKWKHFAVSKCQTFYFFVSSFLYSVWSPVLFLNVNIIHEFYVSRDKYTGCMTLTWTLRLIFIKWTVKK